MEEDWEEHCKPSGCSLSFQQSNWEWRCHIFKFLEKVKISEKTKYYLLTTEMNWEYFSLPQENKYSDSICDEII